MGQHAAVIGGGISGLATAHNLLDRGFEVTLFESDSALGGLASTFPWRDTHLERFYHCVLPTDDALLRLIDAAGLSGDLAWRETRMGFMHGGRVFPLNTPIDLLRFAPLGMIDRLRLGLMGLRAGSLARRDDLDETAVTDWVSQLVGRRAFEKVWRPLLEAKMGDGYLGIPALWLSNRMHREKNTKRELRGCLSGGYRELIDAVERSLRARGARIHFGRPVQRIDRDGERMAVVHAGGFESFDLAVSTLPLVEFQRMTRSLGISGKAADLVVDYQGVVSGVFITRVPLSDFYWMPIVDSGATTQGVIEMSHLVSRERTHGLWVNYFVNYTHRGGPLFARSDDEIRAAYRADLERLFPHAANEVVDTFVFRAPFVEPLWTLGYNRRKPPYSVIPGKLYLLCTAQVYPRVNSWNSCCEIVEEMMPGLVEETGAAAVAARVAAGRS